MAQFLLVEYDSLDFVDHRTQSEALFEDLIEQAYLEALIDGDQQTLAYCWLRSNHQREH